MEETNNSKNQVLLAVKWLKKKKWINKNSMKFATHATPPIQLQKHYICECDNAFTYTTTHSVFHTVATTRTTTLQKSQFWENFNRISVNAIKSENVALLGKVQFNIFEIEFICVVYFTSLYSYGIFMVANSCWKDYRSLDRTGLTTQTTCSN